MFNSLPEELRLIVVPLLALIAALVISFAATPLVKEFAKRVGAMDVPKDGRRMHNMPIPRLGGLAIFWAFCSAF
jgi:UDP-GlcNAc:undecaprenyl-phosphate GlcNAc-1-phosphate transferase